MDSVVGKRPRSVVNYAEYNYDSDCLEYYCSTASTSKKNKTKKLKSNQTISRESKIVDSDMSNSLDCDDIQDTCSNSSECSDLSGVYSMDENFNECEDVVHPERVGDPPKTSITKPQKKGKVPKTKKYTKKEVVIKSKVDSVKLPSLELPATIDFSNFEKLYDEDLIDSITSPNTITSPTSLSEYSSLYEFACKPKPLHPRKVFSRQKKLSFVRELSERMHAYTSLTSVIEPICSGVFHTGQEPKFDVIDKIDDQAIDLCLDYANAYVKKHRIQISKYYLSNPINRGKVFVQHIIHLIITYLENRVNFEGRYVKFWSGSVSKPYLSEMCVEIILLTVQAFFEIPEKLYQYATYSNPSNNSIELAMQYGFA